MNSHFGIYHSWVNYKKKEYRGEYNQFTNDDQGKTVTNPIFPVGGAQTGSNQGYNCEIKD